MDDFFVKLTLVHFDFCESELKTLNEKELIYKMKHSLMVSHTI